MVQINREKRKVKLGYYLLFGNAKTDLGTLSMEDWRKAWNEFAEELKAIDMELVHWGGAFGTTEDVVAILKGDIQNYEKLWPALWQKFPLGTLRTVFVGDPANQ